MNEPTSYLPALTEPELAEVEAALDEHLGLLLHLGVTERYTEAAAITRSVLTAVREARMRLREIRPL